MNKIASFYFIAKDKVLQVLTFAKNNLTDDGIKLKEKAKAIPQVLDGSIHLSYDEKITLRGLLNKALEGTKKHRL